MKKLLSILVLCSLLWYCNSNNGGQEEKPSDAGAPSSTIWKGRVMVSPDSLNWVAMHRYDPGTHIGYDTVFKYFTNTSYSGDLPPEDTGWQSYFTDSAGHVVSHGWIKSEYSGTAGGMISFALYNSNIHVGYYNAYYIHINK